ncbi:hypothetical protein BDV11DRAFT_165885 [Aspergillus similis]
MVDNPVLDVGKLFDESLVRKPEEDSDGSEIPTRVTLEQSRTRAILLCHLLRSVLTGAPEMKPGARVQLTLKKQLDENAIIFFKGYIDSTSSSNSDSDPSASDDSESEAHLDSNGLGATPYSRFLRSFMDDGSGGDDGYVPIGDSDGDSDGGLHLRSRYGQTGSFRRRTKSALEACLRFFCIFAADLTCIFQLSRPIDLLLYDSPPILRPSEPLMIWPMSPGNVLFADFKNLDQEEAEANNYIQYSQNAIFPLREIPSHRDTRSPKETTQAEKEQRKISISQVRLGFTRALPVRHHAQTLSRKTTRALPMQIYRTKNELGHFHTLPISQLPFALTRTSSQLYFTVDRKLTVFRIKLFPTRDRKESDEPVLVPRESVFLLATAKTREVRFLPSSSAFNISEDKRDQGEEAMHVLVGSQVNSSCVLLAEVPSTSNLDSAHDERRHSSRRYVLDPPVVAVCGVEGSVPMPVGFLYLE